MSIPIPSWPPDWPEIEAAAVAAIRSGLWGEYHSQLCSSLAQRLASRFSSSQVRLCCSGSAAIEIALRAAKVGPGDEVILAAYDYPGNFRTVELLGARPVLVDVGQDSACLQAGQLAAAASDRVRAVIASHLFGVAAEIQEIRQQCDLRGWILVEDACQVPGMSVGGTAAGSFGHFGALSFGGSKPISAGSGGALLTSDPRMAARLGPLLDRPSDVMPLAPLQAAVIGPQLDRLDQLNRQRSATARWIESTVQPSLDSWQWLSRSQHGVEPAHYKVAWCAKSANQRQRVVQAATTRGLPIGDGFKSMSASSQRRCRKPVPLVNADRFGQRLFVMDHTALLMASNQRDILAGILHDLHAETGED